MGGDGRVEAHAMAGSSNGASCESSIFCDQNMEFQLSDGWKADFMTRIRKRNILPKDLEDLLEKDDKNALKAVFEACNVNARTSYNKAALHQAVDVGNVENIHLLLERGARMNAKNNVGLTPLEYILQWCENCNIECVAEMVDILLDAGARKTKRMRDFIRRIGTDFERDWKGFNPKRSDARRAALGHLYVLFDVPPVPQRVTYDDKPLIRVEVVEWGG